MINWAGEEFEIATLQCTALFTTSLIGILTLVLRLLSLIHFALSKSRYIKQTNQQIFHLKTHRLYLIIT